MDNDGTVLGRSEHLLDNAVAIATKNVLLTEQESVDYGTTDSGRYRRLVLLNEQQSVDCDSKDFCCNKRKDWEYFLK